MIKPIVLNEYYLSPNDVRAIAETTLALYVSSMMRKRDMLSESEHNYVLDECAHRIAPAFSLLEGNTYESRKRIYTPDQLVEEFVGHFDQMLNENIFGDIWNGVKNVGKGIVNGVKGAGKWIGDKAEQFGMWKRGDGFGRNMARVFGFNPDEGFSLGNIINGAVTLGSLVAAPFTGGGSLAAGTALRTALATGGRVAANALLKGGAKAIAGNAAKALGKTLIGTHAINAGLNLAGAGPNSAPAETSGQPQYADAGNAGDQGSYSNGYSAQNPYSALAQNPYSIYGGQNLLSNAYSGGNFGGRGGYGGGVDPMMQYLLSQQGGGMNPYTAYGMA